jgi:hypothetical protein
MVFHDLNMGEGVEGTRSSIPHVSLKYLARPNSMPRAAFCTGHYRGLFLRTLFKGRVFGMWAGACKRYWGGHYTGTDILLYCSLFNRDGRRKVSVQ